MERPETIDDRNPLLWSEATAANVLKATAGYVRKYSQPDCPAPMDPEAREEVTARIVFDVVTGGEIPDGVSILHHVFRKCRLWRLRGWAGDCELDRDRKREESSREREDERTPGTESFERAARKSAFRGYSDDSRQPTPLAQLVAIETAERAGLRYVPPWQARHRRRAVKGCRVTVVRVIPGPIVGRIVIDTETGEYRPEPGTYQRVEFREEAVAERGRWNVGKRSFEPYTGHVGTVENRSVGKAKTVPVPVGLSRWALLGRTVRHRFTPAPLPTAGVPATPGDGTEWRALPE